MVMRGGLLALALSAVCGVGLAACASDSYHAYEAGEGYSEQRLSDSSWRVSFVGSLVESQQAVEAQLLRRAAELTAQNGHAWFAAAVRDAPADEEIVVVGERPQTAPEEPVWRPHWRRRVGVRWTDWDPQGPGRSTEPLDANPASQQRYFATAEIIMGDGPRPPAAFDPAAVLGPSVR